MIMINDVSKAFFEAPVKRFVCVELPDEAKCQEDYDNDLIGDACDPCDNLVYILGNLNGDTDENGIPVIDIMDILSLVDFLIFDDSYECQDPILNINGDEFVNVVDVIALVQSILNGAN